jgi:choline dehydrogenase-like flavoprotein
MMGVSGLAGDPAYPPKQPPMPPLPLGKSGARFGKAMNQLGWHWWPSDSTIATTDYEGRARCINLGHCTPGCAQGAKASTDITYWPHAIRAGVELRTMCRVREVTVDEHGMASGVIYYDAEGREQFQPAEVVILACNGVGTPRLMLNSVSAKFPNGIANSSGLVGKNLMFHPYALTYGYVDEPLDGNTARRCACGARNSTRPTLAAISCAAIPSSSAAASAPSWRRSSAQPLGDCPGATTITPPTGSW